MLEFALSDVYLSHTMFICYLQGQIILNYNAIKYFEFF